MAKSSTCNISIRMDSNLKAAAEALYEELGMNLSTAFNIFVRQSLRERGIPFKITEGTPSKETVSAMLEAERIAKDPTVKGYHDVDEFFDVLREDPLDQWYEIGSVITIMNAKLEDTLSEEAEYLLAYTELTVGQVAQTVGYSTSSRFAELFRKSTGLLPLEYRKNAQRK